MIDMKRIQENPDEYAALLSRRRIKSVDLAELKATFAKVKAIRLELETQRAERNSASKEIGNLMAQGKKPEAEKRKAEVKGLGDKISTLEQSLKEFDDALEVAALDLPNWLDGSVPDGSDETHNVVLREWGKKPVFDFQPKPHYDVGEATGSIDFDAGVKLAGARFYVLRNKGARLERALSNFMLDLHTKEFGYGETGVPELVTDQCMQTTGQYPKFQGEFYRLAEDALSLIPTGEVPLTNLFREQILDTEDLPVRLTALTNCYRREAGAAGKDTRGMIRVHQFKKVELVQVSAAEASNAVHEQMLSHAEEVLRRLDLHYRVLLLCSGDIGSSMAKTFDLEVWMPGLDRYVEISSISNAWDFQARRGMIRHRPRGSKEKPALVHTLNGSALAVGRTMAAVIENYQTKDGAYEIPSALRTYMEP